MSVANRSIAQPHATQRRANLATVKSAPNQLEAQTNCNPLRHSILAGDANTMQTAGPMRDTIARSDAHIVELTGHNNEIKQELDDIQLCRQRVGELIGRFAPLAVERALFVEASAALG